VVDFNTAAQNLLPDLNSSWVGQPVKDVFQKYPLIQNQVLKNLKTIEFDAGMGTGRRSINSQLTLAQSEPSEPIGKIITLNDVTEQKQSQAYLVHAEKIAVLGQLAANITQEINDPLMAIKAAAEDIESSFDTLWQQIPELFGEMSEKRRGLFMTILNKLQNIPCLTTREERDSLRKLTPILQEYGWGDSHNISRRIIKLGLSEDFIQLVPLLQDERDTALLEFILVIALLRKDARTIIQAEERTAKIVYALKSYSQLPDAEQPVLTDIQAGVETVLRMYGNLMKNGITTITRFQKVPAIKAYPDELQQVWTNLIYNAIQAMEGQGELMIEIEQDGDEVIVSFIDNGPGIPAEILPWIFEPLFTTKKVGEGTGIGLNICKKIIERHHGRINVQSKPGQTQFWVCLPVIQEWVTI
jgi:two-component system NtrC family sensor kinase